MLLALASVTDSLVTLATHIINDLGLAGVAILTTTSGVIGAPGSEPTMLFAGFDVSRGNLSLLGIIVFGVIGDVLGASIAYWIGYWGRRELFERHGRKVHMSKGKIEFAGGWMERHGGAAVFISRFIPFVRAAFPYAAGVSEYPFGRFVAFTTLGSIVWITGLGVLGRAVGHYWQTWRHHLEYVDYLGVALVVGAIVYLIVRRARGGRRPAVDAVSE